MSELSLTVSKTIPAAPEKVFNAWLDPAMLKKFMVTCEGDGVPKAESDAREGGQFLIVMESGGKEIPHSGTYLELKPHSRLVFTWESPHSVDGSTVTVDLAPTGDGATDLTLTQVKFATEGARDGHIKGWTAILDMLERVAA
ncbi:SRPBCC domain-containing protein [Oricola sp.]|uniref:SRPBCC family protein n=1 Tax=Oricola sp. TaxID=1979950 RepID=UPI003513A1E5